METQDYIELPIDLEGHQWFMYVCSKFDVEVRIMNGVYRIIYKDAADLFQIGKQVSRSPHKEFYTHYGLPKED